MCVVSLVHGPILKESYSSTSEVTDITRFVRRARPSRGESGTC